MSRDSSKRSTTRYSTRSQDEKSGQSNWHKSQNPPIGSNAGCYQDLAPLLVAPPTSYQQHSGVHPSIAASSSRGPKGYALHVEIASKDPNHWVYKPKDLVRLKIRLEYPRNGIPWGSVKCVGETGSGALPAPGQVQIFIRLLNLYHKPLSTACLDCVAQDIALVEVKEEEARPAQLLASGLDYKLRLKCPPEHLRLDRFFVELLLRDHTGSIITNKIIDQPLMVSYKQAAYTNPAATFSNPPLGPVPTQPRVAPRIKAVSLTISNYGWQINVVGQDFNAITTPYAVLGNYPIPLQYTDVNNMMSSLFSLENEPVPRHLIVDIAGQRTSREYVNSRSEAIDQYTSATVYDYM